MAEDLRLRNFSPTTQRDYLLCARRFAAPWIGQSMPTQQAAQVGPDYPPSVLCESSPWTMKNYSAGAW
jgi:hypothetical protein